MNYKLTREIHLLNPNLPYAGFSNLDSLDSLNSLDSPQYTILTNS